MESGVIKIGNRKRGIFLMLICSLLWSCAGFIIKLVPWNPLVIVCFRGAFGLVFMLPYMIITKRKIVLSLRSLLIGVGIMLVAVLYVTACKLTAGANAIVLQYTSTAFLMIFSAIFFKKLFKPRDIVAVVLTFLGIVLFFLDELSAGSLLGNIIAVLDGVALAFMYMLSGESEENVRLSGQVVGHALTAIVGLPFVLTIPTPYTLGSMAAVALLGVVVLALPYAIYSSALKSCTPLACALLAAVEVVLNPAWVMLVIGETPGLWALIGSIIIVCVITAWCVLDAKGAVEQNVS